MFSCCTDPGEIRRTSFEEGGHHNNNNNNNRNKHNNNNSRSHATRTPPRNFALDHHEMTKMNNKNEKKDKKNPSSSNDDNDDSFSSSDNDEQLNSHSSASQTPAEREQARHERQKRRKLRKLKESKNRNCLSVLCACGAADDDFDYAAELERRKKRQETREQELMARMRGPRQEVSPNDRALLTRCREILMENANSLALRECIKILIGTKGGRCLLFRRYLEKTLAGFQIIRKALSESKFLIAHDTCMKIRALLEQDGVIYELKIYENEEALYRDDKSFADSVAANASLRSPNRKDETVQISKILKLFEAQSLIGIGRNMDAINVCCDLMTILEKEDPSATSPPAPQTIKPSSSSPKSNKDGGGGTVVTVSFVENPLSGPPSSSSTTTSRQQQPPNTTTSNVSAFSSMPSPHRKQQQQQQPRTPNTNNKLSVAMASTVRVIHVLIAKSAVLYLRCRAKAFQALSLVTQFKEESKLNNNNNNLTSPTLGGKTPSFHGGGGAPATTAATGPDFRARTPLVGGSSSSATSTTTTAPPSYTVLPTAKQLTADAYGRLENAAEDVRESINLITQAYQVNRYFRTQQLQAHSQPRGSVFESEELNPNLEFFFVYRIQDGLFMLAEFEKRLMLRDFQDMRQTMFADFLDEQMNLEDDAFEKRMNNIRGAVERRAKREALAEEERKRLEEEEAAAAAAEEERRRKKQEQQQKRYNQHYYNTHHNQQQQNNTNQRKNPPSSNAPSPFEVKRKAALEILELSDIPLKDLTDETLKHKFRKLSLKWHPDRWSGTANAEKRVEAEEKMKKINEANQFLRENVL